MREKHISHPKSPTLMSTTEILKAGDKICQRVNKITRDREKLFGSTPKKVILSANLFFLMAEYAVVCEEFSGNNESISLEQFLGEEDFEFNTGIGVIPCDINILFPSDKIEVEWEK